MARIVSSRNYKGLEGPRLGKGFLEPRAGVRQALDP